MKTLIEANPSTTEVCSVLRFAQENDPFLGHLGPCDEKWILYDNRRGQWLNRKETRKYYPKPKFHQKKEGDCLVVQIWIDSPQISESRWNNHSWETLQRSRWNSYVSSTSRQKWSNPLARQMLGHMLEKLDELINATRLYPPGSPDPSPTDYIFF